MKALKSLERSINIKVRKIDPHYAITNLARTVDGKFHFDLKVTVDPRHFVRIRNVLREVLGTLPVEKQVQAKFYLAESLSKQVKKRAKSAGISQSELVSRCISDFLRKKKAAGIG